MESSYYLVEKEGAIATVWLNRPEKKNAMNPPAWIDSVGIFKELDEDPEVRVIIVAGKGKDFCAGIDLFEIIGMLPELLDPEQKGGVKWPLLSKLKLMQDGLTVIERIRKPVIAAVQGKCIGGGLDLICACDIRLAAADASFSLREAAVGMVADMGVLQRLPLIVGQGIAREMAYTAKFIDAPRAREVNLVNEVFPDADALHKGARALAEEILGAAPIAVQASKDVLNQAITSKIDEGLGYVAAVSGNIVPSNDLMEAVTAMGEKRAPKFTGT